MLGDFYFFDQYSRASLLGGVRRSKRNLKDFNQALNHVKFALALNDEQPSQTGSHTPTIMTKQINGGPSQPILGPSKKSLVPEILTKQLDRLLRTFEDRSETTSPSTDRSKTPEQETNNNNKELIHPTSNIPKVSLPAQLILQLNLTWCELIKDTNYKYKVWRTKTAEEAWRRHVQREGSAQLKIKKQAEICVEKPVVHRRTSSRLSVASITADPRVRSSRSFSRGSFLGASNLSQDQLRLLKAMQQGTTETVIDAIKNGIHVEFKLSIQDETSKQQIASFDVPKPDLNFDEDILTFTQNKCKCLLAEAKRKIRETNVGQDKRSTSINRIRLYEDNQPVRNRNAVSASSRRQKSKFALSILRQEIPEKFNIDIDTPETKRKCYIELVDGSTQIYYPSGRLAVLRLRSPISTTLFFDDIDTPTHQFLGLVTSTGKVLLIQPTFHARFIANNKFGNGYLCNGKTGTIEKEFQWHTSNSNQRKSLPIDEDTIYPSVLESTVQLQINSCMQLEYHNPSNVLFAFTCQNEQFKFQLGVHLPRQPSALMNVATKILANRRISRERISPSLIKRSNSIVTNDDKKKVQKHSHQLLMMQELFALRKRIKDICHNWLQECRTTLGILHVDAYHLPDLPSQPTVTQTKPQIIDNSRGKSARENRLQPSSNSKPFLLNQKFESNVIANTIEQFVPRSATGRSMKQRIYNREILPTPAPVIK